MLHSKEIINFKGLCITTCKKPKTENQQSLEMDWYYDFWTQTVFVLFP